MSDEKPVQLKRKVSSLPCSVDTDLVCIVHYERSCDPEIRPLTNAQFETVAESASVRQRQTGHRLYGICGSITLQFNQSIHGVHRWCYKNFTNVSRLRDRSATPVPCSTVSEARTSGRTSTSSRPSTVFPQNMSVLRQSQTIYQRQ